jgi:hypothetical protein
LSFTTFTVHSCFFSKMDNEKGKGKQEKQRVQINKEFWRRLWPLLKVAFPSATAKTSLCLVAHTFFLVARWTSLKFLKTMLKCYTHPPSLSPLYRRVSLKDRYQHCDCETRWHDCSVDCRKKLGRICPSNGAVATHCVASLHYQQHDPLLGRFPC